MMRSPYQSPTEAPKQRFLRRRPIEPHGKGRWVLAGIGVVAAYLVYTFVFSDSGLLKIAALKRETEVLKMVAKGMSYKQIAERLVISHRTVQNHVQNTLRKLQMHNRVELTRYAIEQGLDDPE